MKLGIISLAYLILIFTCIQGWSQTDDADSLLKKLDYVSGKTRIEVLYELIKTYQNSETAKALDYAKEATNLSLRIGDSLLIGQSIQTMGNMYMLTGDLALADSCYILAEACFTIQVDSVHMAGLKIDQSVIRTRQNKLGEAQRLLQDALPIVRSRELLQKEFKGLNTLAGVYYNQGNYDDALIITKRISDLSLELRRYSFYAATQLNIGTLYNVKGDFVNALIHFQKGFKMADSVEAVTYFINANESIGNLHMERKRFDEALPYFDQALRLCTQHNLQPKKVAVLNSLGNLYLKREQFARADSLLELAISLSKKIDDQQLHATSRTLLGMNYTKWNKPEKAIPELNEAVSYFESQGILNQSVHVNHALAESYFKLGELNKAETFARKSLDQAISIGQKKAEMSANEILADIYTKTNQMSAAYRHLEQADILEDSLFQVDQSIIIEEMNAKFELEKRNEEINHLQDQAVLQEVLVGKQKTQLLTIAAGAVLFFLFSVILYRSNRAKTATNQVLKNLINDKEILLKEVHHRVKNNLQVVNTMLRLQDRRSDSDEAHELIQEIEGRIHAIGLIHEDLYQKEEVKHVDMHSYLTKLMNNNLHLHNVNGAIHYSIQAEVQIPLDVAIPVALISNELITNALKHAFPEGREGKINVSLSHQKNAEYVLTIEDDGVGMNPGKKKAQNSFGLEIIETLADQLNGRFQMVANGSTKACLTFRTDDYESIDS